MRKKNGYQAQVIHKGITYRKFDKSELQCAGYVNYWHKSLKLPLPHPDISPIKPPPTIEIGKVKLF